MAIEFYGIPDMSAKSRISFPIVWQDKEYSFTIYNNTRSEELGLKVTTEDDDGDEVIIAKNLNMVINVDLLNLIQSEYIEGRLYIVNNNNNSVRPTFLDIGDNYSFVMLTEDEFE